MPERNGEQYPYPIGPLSLREISSLTALLRYAAGECTLTGSVADLEQAVVERLLVVGLHRMRQ